MYKCVQLKPVQSFPGPKYLHLRKNFWLVNSEFGLNFQNIENTCDALTRTPGTKDCDNLFFGPPGNSFYLFLILIYFLISLGNILIYFYFLFLASQDALEVMLVTYWRVVSIDLTDVTLVSDDT